MPARDAIKCFVGAWAFDSEAKRWILCFSWLLRPFSLVFSPACTRCLTEARELVDYIGRGNTICIWETEKQRKS
jgi:hypothetical protein